MSEMWVDKQTVEIVAPSQWHSLNLNQLSDVKSQIMNKIYMAKGNQVYLKPLNRALGELEVLIAKKLADPHGQN